MRYFHPVRSELSKHPYAYFILIVVLFCVVVAYLIVWPNVLLERLIALFVGVFYFLWGILTHTKVKRITRRVVLEYLTVALIATLFLLLMTY